jgi:hypothetical protein
LNPTHRIRKTATSSEIFSIFSQVYIEFRVFRSELIEKGHSDLSEGQGNNEATTNLRDYLSLTERAIQTVTFSSSQLLANEKLSVSANV